MRQPLRQVGATVPLWRLRGNRLVRRGIVEQRIPHTQRGANAEGKWQVRLLGRGRIHRRHALHEVGIHGGDVLIRRLGVRGVRHGGVEVGTICTLAMAQRIAKLLQRIVANTVGFGGRDVGRNNRPQGAGQRQSTSHGFAAGCRVAGNTVTRRGQVAATLNVGGVVGKSRCSGQQHCSQPGRFHHCLVHACFLQP